jgi:hypothetical protein
MTQLYGCCALNLGLLDLSLLHDDLLMLVLMHHTRLHHGVMVVDRMLGDHIDRGGVMAHGDCLAGTEQQDSGDQANAEQDAVHDGVPLVAVVGIRDQSMMGSLNRG